MSNSKLVNYVKISPNSTNPRNTTIKKITIHHMAGNLTVEKCGEIFLPTSREASSNYGIGTDGRLGMYVEESNRAWTSGSSENDNQAITIEVANDGGEPNWHVSEAALAKLDDLCVDICKRNGILRLNFTGNAAGNLTMHRYFQATTCPGPYLASQFSSLASKVNSRLSDAEVAVTPSPTKSLDQIAHEVISGKWGNGDLRKKALETAGYDYTTVQDRVTDLLTHEPINGVAKKSIDEIAYEVIKGKWGSGEARKRAIKTAGYDYTTVQHRVNDLLTHEPVKPVIKKSIDGIAKEVIKGKWGSGEVRKKALKTAGYDYTTVQHRVNELMK